MAKKDNIDIGDPDYLPPQRISGSTPEECDAEVAARIKDLLVRILNSMGNIPEIAEGDVVPDVALMTENYEHLGVMIRKLGQRLERHNPPPKASAKQRKKRRSQPAASITDGFD